MGSKSGRAKVICSRGRAMTDYIQGYAAKGFRFDCPACGEPWATIREPVIDIHLCGSTYHCDEEGCGKAIIFEAMVAPE